MRDDVEKRKERKEKEEVEKRQETVLLQITSVEREKWDCTSLSYW